MSIPGFSLLYAILMMTIILILTASMISINYLNNRQSLSILHNRKVNSDLESACELLLDPTFLSEKNNRNIKISLYGEKQDSLEIRKSKWGIFELIRVTEAKGLNGFFRIALVGDYMHEHNSPALILEDKDKPLCLCGNTLLRGVVYAPRSGIKASIVNGRGFERKNLVEGDIITQPQKFPIIDRFVENLNASGSWLKSQNTIQKISFSGSIFTDTLINSFQNDPIILRFLQDVTITNSVIDGNIIIVSNSKIIIDQNNKICDPVFLSRKIIIKPEFKGSGQFIASDTLLCDHLCSLKYPSVLAIVTLDKKVIPYFQISEKSVVQGIVLLYSKYQDEAYNSFACIDPKSIVIGSVYTNYSFSLGGKVMGNVVTPGFKLLTPTGILQNYLIDAEINYENQPLYFVGIQYTESKFMRNIIKWLK
jgi:hypothetical protein